MGHNGRSQGLGAGTSNRRDGVSGAEEVSGS